MIAMDFYFDGLYLSDFGCIIVNFNNDNRETSGGNTEYDSVKAPGRDKFRFYGSQYNEPLSTTISIMKNPCLSDSIEDMNFNHNEERKITKWLKKTDGYKLFKYAQGNENIQNPYFSVAMGKEIGSDSDIWYQVKIDVVPHRLYDDLIGFDLTITSNCAYGFTDTITKQATINSTTPFSFEVDTDADEYIYPEKFEIKNFSQCFFNIENTKDLEHRASLDTATKFYDLNFPITMDSNNIKEENENLGQLYNLNMEILSTVSKDGVSLLETSKYTVLNKTYDYTVIYLKMLTDDTGYDYIYTHGVTISFLDANGKVVKMHPVDLNKQREVLLFFDTRNYERVAMGCDYSVDKKVNVKVLTYNLNYENLLKNFRQDYSKIKLLKSATYSTSGNCKIDRVLGLFIFDENDNLLNQKIYLNPSEEIKIQQETYNEKSYVLINMMPYEGYLGSIPNYVPLTVSTVTYIPLPCPDSINLDCDNEIITGLDNPNHFNWYFPRLIDGSNEIVTDSVNDIDIEITYREARMVAL